MHHTPLGVRCSFCRCHIRNPIRNCCSTFWTRSHAAAAVSTCGSLYNGCSDNARTRCLSVLYRQIAVHNAIITEKLRSVVDVGRSTSTTKEQLRRIIAALQTPTHDPVLTTHRVNCSMQEFRNALQRYVVHKGCCDHSQLPRAACTLDAISASVYLQFVSSDGEAYDLRWALCRILLGLQNQWWWLHFRFSAWEADSLIHDIWTETSGHKYGQSNPSCLISELTVQEPMPPHGILTNDTCTKTMIMMVRHQAV